MPAWLARFGTSGFARRTLDRLLARPFRRFPDGRQSAQHHEPGLDSGDDGVRPDGVSGDGAVRSVDRRDGDARRLCRDVPARSVSRHDQRARWRF